MKNIYCLLLTIGLNISALAQTKQAPPTPGPAPEIQIGKVEAFDLSNGLKVYIVENHKVPTVSISLVLDNNPIMQGEKNGYVDMVGALLRTGTKTRNKDQIDEEIDFIGATLNTYSSGLMASSLTKHMPKLFELTADVVINSQFKQEELDKLKKQSLSGLASAKANPSSVENMIRNTLVFGKNHPYGELLTEKTIENITLPDLQAYYNTYFKPNVGYLAIVGDVNPKVMKKMVKKYFGAWKKGNVPQNTLPAIKPIEGTRVAIIDRPGAVQTVLSYANTADLKHGSEDVVTARVMNTILGGPYSRLMNNLREKRGYTYGAYSQLQPNRFASQFSVNTNVRNVVTDSATSQLVLELYKMRAGKPELAELQKAQNMVSGEFARSLENPETVALFAINTARYNLPKDFYSTFLKKVAAVTPEAVGQAAQKYITPTNAYIIAVGNADYIERRLARFDADGDIEYYDASGNKVERASLTVPAGLTAELVLDKYIAAIGGKAALETIKDVTIKSTITSPAATLSVTLLQKGTDKIHQSLKFNNQEVQRTVVNGTKGRAQSSGGQDKILSATEIMDNKIKNSATSILNFDKFGIKKNLVGMERIDGRAAYRVELTLPTGKRHIHYFDSETGLKLREVEIEETDLGSALQTTNIKAYKEVNGIKFPHRMELVLGNQVIATDVQSIELNKNLKDDTFKVQ